MTTAVEQEKVMTSLDALLKQGASDSELVANMEEFTEKFADDGAHRKATVEFHLRNVARLLMPTTTTSVAMRALQGGSGGGANGATSSTSTSNIPTTTKAAQTPPVQETTPPTPAGNNPQTSQTTPTATSASANTNTIPTAASFSSTEPKALFQYLVNYLQVTPAQASALKDSRHVAKELDGALAKSLEMLAKLRSMLTQSSHELEVEMKKIRSILTTRQAAKFLVWVANNGACMHMLNELWSKVYPKPVVSPVNAEGKFDFEEMGTTTTTSEDGGGGGDKNIEEGGADSAE